VKPTRRRPGELWPPPIGDPMPLHQQAAAGSTSRARKLIHLVVRSSSWLAFAGSNSTALITSWHRRRVRLEDESFVFSLHAGGSGHSLGSGRVRPPAGRGTGGGRR